MDLKPDVFRSKDPAEVAKSLKASAEHSDRRKAEPFRSAMSMLDFYINRAGRNLKPLQRRTLEKAKDVLRALFGKPASPAAKKGASEKGPGHRTPVKNAAAKKIPAGKTATKAAAAPKSAAKKAAARKTAAKKTAARKPGATKTAARKAAARKTAAKKTAARKTAAA